MSFYGKVTVMHHILIIFVLGFVASTQKPLSGLETSEASWFRDYQTTTNPQSILSSSTHLSVNPALNPTAAASPSPDVTLDLLNTHPGNAGTLSSKTTSTDFTVLQPLTENAQALSTIELPNNTKQSPTQDDLASPTYEFMSILRPSTHIFVIKNSTTTKPLKNLPNMNQSNVKHLNVQAAMRQSQQPSNYGQNILTSDDSGTRPDFGDLIQILNDSHIVNTSQEQDMLAWFNNVNPGLRKSPGINVFNSTFEGENVFSGRFSTEDFEPCNENCSKNQRVCVMGNDFKPHCVVAEDACQQMRCVSGECVSKDGLYTCECNQGWVGTFCEKPCTLDCGENGNCGYIDQNSTFGCICHWNYTGQRCEEKRKIMSNIIEVKVGDKVKTWETAVAAVLAVVVLALSCILLPYLLWRRQWVPIRKLVFYFQEFEDDDDKEYDAFVSYKSTPNDERFILRHLYPKLEKELHFKLCLHFRDFPPGEPIANNIIRAIEGSRRTIMILSPSFISSEWCRMEYQKAQYEMLRLKHKIIPIIIEDISDVPEIDKNLKTIIDTVTYITWPGDDESTSGKRLAKFWKLLELSMPKRRPEYNRSISSSGSCSSEVPLTAVCDACSSSGVSSLTEDDFTGTSTSRTESNASSSSTCTTSEGSTCPSIGQPSISNDLQLQIETACTFPLTPPRAACHEKTVLGNSESNNEGKLSCNPNPIPRVVERIVSNPDTSYDERERHDVNTKEPTNDPKPQLVNIFHTSDDHIVEIREVGLGAKGLTIKPRPRQLTTQLFV